MATGKHVAMREVRRGRTLVVLTVLVMLAALLVAAPSAGVGSNLIDDFESGLPSGSDGDGVSIGFFTHQGAGSSIGISDPATPPAPVLPAVGTPNRVLELDVDSTSFAGVIHAFENAPLATWVSQDWSAYEGVALWLHGQNTGTSLFFDLLDNRNPGSTTDDAERWTVSFTDDFSGWQEIEFRFSDFARKEIGNGAPNDGLGLTEVHGWGFGTLGTGGPLTYYLDAVSLFGSPSVDAVTVNCGDDPLDVAIIHYNRPTGDYGDHTTGDFNDFWGLHLWGDAIDLAEVTDWPDPKPFEGEDEFGRFAWIERGGTGSQIGFIIHQGDTKDTPDDRFFDADVNPEVWINQGDETIYTSRVDAQGFVTIHYHRDDADYGTPSPEFNTFWGLHLWGAAIDPTEVTVWPDPKQPDGIDDYGAFWNVLIDDSSQPVNFIIHRGDIKDPGPDQSMIPIDDASVWVMSGDATIYGQRGEAEGFATIHYHRDAGDYGDNSSPNFNDFWGLHVWTGALNPNPSWPEPVRWVDHDEFGPVFEIDLLPSATELAYIIHRGDEKDPGPDQFMVFADVGYESWQQSGGDARCVNTPPTADANGPYTWLPNVALTLDGTSSYDLDGDALTYDWDWGDGSPVSTDAGPTPSHTYTLGTFVVTLTVTDEFGDSDTATATVIINTPPVAEALGPYPVNEGSTVTLDGTGSSDVDGDPITYAWDLDNDGSYDDSSSAIPSIGPFDDGPASYTVGLQVTDPTGATDTDTATVNVGNVAPTVSPITVVPTLVEVGNPVAASATFTDPGVADTHAALWDWGDGTTPGTVTQGAGFGSVADSHAYGAAGIYAIELAVTDDDGGAATSVFEFVVVYDPSEGFVTGGGWIYSDPGSYKPDPTLEGKATFGLVAKYKKGANVPDGNTQFQFKAGDLNFHSTSYDWLVVTGSNFAKFKGVGTINGTGEYKFQIWAGDDDPDTFRIKIWYEDEFDVETVVYDNGFGQAVGGGSIIIHTKK